MTALAVVGAACAGPLPTAAPTPVATPSEPGTGPGGPQSSEAQCDPDDRRQMAATVTAQLAAIADDDWEQALTYTSSDFRAAFDAIAFERVIVDGFPVVSDAVASDATLCRRPRDDAATLLVTVEDRDGGQQDLLYVFEREDERWLIGGAGPVDAPDEGTISV